MFGVLEADTSRKSPFLIQFKTELLKTIHDTCLSL